MNVRRPGGVPSSKPQPSSKGDRNGAYEQSRALYDGDFRKWTNSSMIDEIVDELKRPDNSSNDVELRGRILLNFAAGLTFGFIPQAQRENSIRALIAAFADKGPRAKDAVLGELLVRLTVALRRNRIPNPLFDNTVYAFLVLLDDPRYDKEKRAEALGHLANSTLTRSTSTPALPEAVRNRLIEHMIARVQDQKVSREGRMEVVAALSMTLSLGEPPARFEGDIVMAALNTLQSVKEFTEVSTRIARNLGAFYGCRPKNMTISQEALIRRRLSTIVQSKLLPPDASADISRNLNAGYIARNYPG